MALQLKSVLIGRNAQGKITGTVSFTDENGNDSFIPLQLVTVLEMLNLVLQDALDYSASISTTTQETVDTLKAGLYD